ncbi:MAG: hypothetical protein H7Y43_07070 [Akkermansiaceae bacterium]|nr:hypothetical protein [Verrucomicrobiales bacterium]
MAPFRNLLKRTGSSVLSPAEKEPLMQITTTMIHRFCRCLGLLAACFYLSGCATAELESEAAEPEFPARSVASKSFRFDSQDRKRAITAYRKLGANLIFEIIIDRKGNVEEIRVLRTKLDDTLTAGFKAYVARMEFTPAQTGDPYPFRALYYPMKTKEEIIIY